MTALEPREPDASWNDTMLPTAPMAFVLADRALPALKTMGRIQTYASVRMAMYRTVADMEAASDPVVLLKMKLAELVPGHADRRTKLPEVVGVASSMWQPVSPVIVATAGVTLNPEAAEAMVITTDPERMLRR